MFFQLFQVWRGRLFWLFNCLCTLFIITGCSPEFRDEPTTATHLVDRQPAYVLNVHPSEQSTISLTEFLDESKYNSRVCIEWSAFWIVQPGDQLFLDEAIKRTLLTVNEQRDILHATEVSTLVRRTFENGQKAEFSGPFTFCSIVELDVGRQYVVFQIEQLSGEIQQYTWYFDLVQ